MIESLEESKRVATEISEKVVEARDTEVAINDSRNKYRPVAERGAMLFFLLNSLNKIHAFYQYSLNAFVTVFSRGLDLAPGGPKKKENVTLRQLQKRVSGNAEDFNEVIKKAKRQSSNAGGKMSKRATAQSGYMTPGDDEVLQMLVYCVASAARQSPTAHCLQTFMCPHLSARLSRHLT